MSSSLIDLIDKTLPISFKDVSLVLGQPYCYDWGSTFICWICTGCDVQYCTNNNKVVYLQHILVQNGMALVTSWGIADLS